MTQANSFARYAATGNPEAFAEIVTQYQCLVFATCRRTLRNPADVDDAVQETFLRLAQRAAELHTNVGAWLHRCAMNVSIDIKRRGTTRQRHETAATMQSAPADDAQQTLAELREHLDAAMQKLDDDSRELIIQRYFVGRAQVDLAAESGVAPSTIAYRLDRATESLREHLKSMGCAAAIAGGAAALVGAMQAEHASAAVPQALTANLMKIGLSGVGGAAAVSMLFKWLTAIAALLAVGFGIWFVIGQLSAPTAQNAPATQPATAAIPAPAAITVNPGETNTTLPPDWQTTQPSTHRAALAGRVMDANGKPVAGATVQLDGNGVPREEQTTKTDGQGNYTFRTLRGGSGDYTITVTADGFVSIEPYASKEPALQLSSESQARRDFVLQRGVSVQVFATDTNNNPLSNVSVDTSKGGKRFISNFMQMPTDSTGIVKLMLPVSPDPCIVFATLDGYAPAHAIIHAESADAPQKINLVMLPTLNVNGVAICSDQKPASGWNISAEPDWSASNYPLKMASIDKDGNFTLTNIGRGQYLLYLWKGNTGQQVSTVHFPPTTQPIRVDLPFPSPASLVKATGRIRFVGGPATQLRIDVIGLTGNREDIDAEVEMGPSGKGKSRIPGNGAQYTFMAPPGSYSIRFESQTTEAASINRVEIPGDLPLVTLRVIGQPHLTGTVTDASTGAAINHFAVRVRKLETLDNGPDYVQDEQWTQVSNPDGHFDIQCVGPGIYMVQASVNGYAWLWSPQVRLEKGQMMQDVQLRLTPGGALTGKVLDPSNNPVAGAKIIPFSKMQTNAMRYLDTFESNADTTVTDATGKFTLPHLDAGDESLKIVDNNFAPLTISGLKIADKTMTDVGTISLPTGGTVEGTVFDSKGKPLAGTGLRFQNSERFSPFDIDDPIAGWFANVTTDEVGHYRVEHLPEQVIWVGRADLWTQRGQSGVVRRVVHPLDGKTAHLDFGGPAPIKGRLTAGGQPCANKMVELAFGPEGTGPLIVLSTTDSNGSFTFYGPPPGHYTLYYRGGDSRSEMNALRDVEISDQPTDLGEIACDEGDVIINFTFDDPAVASSARWVRVATRFPDSLWQPLISEAGIEGDHMRAKNVPAGQYVIDADIEALPGMTFAAPFDRKANVAETTATMHIPKPTATFKLIDTNPAGENPSHPNVFTVRNEDGTSEFLIDFTQTSTTTSMFPPGTYRIIDSISSQPRQDIDPIVLKDGQTTEIHEDFSKLASNAAVEVALSVWSPDGLLVTSPKPRLLEVNGNPIESTGIEGLGTIFAVHPGHYRAMIDRPSSKPFVKEFDVPQAKSGGSEERFIPIDVVLP